MSDFKIRDSKMAQTFQEIIGDGRVGLDEAQKLIDSAMDGGKITSLEKSELHWILQEHKEMFSANAADKIAEVLGFTSSTSIPSAEFLVRDKSVQRAFLKISEDGVIHPNEVKELIESAKDFGKITNTEKTELLVLLQRAGDLMSFEGKTILAQELGITLVPVNPVVPNGPVTLADLKGNKLDLNEELKAETKSSVISFFRTEGNNVIPDLQISPREVEDPAPKAKIIELSTSDLQNISTGAQFSTKLDELYTQNTDWLLPNGTELKTLLGGDDSRFAYNNISGKRIEQFFTEAKSLINETGLSGDERKAALKALNIKHDDAFRNRPIQFDKADTGTYWSYGNDSAFVHVYEKMLETLPANDPKREVIQNQIDYIFEHKYVPNGSVHENDAEKTLGLMAIDKQSRHVVSITKESFGGVQPQYETLQVPTNSAHALAGKHVYTQLLHTVDPNDPNKKMVEVKYFVEKTGAVLPEELVEKLIHKSSTDVTFRRKEESETFRDSFQYDWNNNGMINQDKVDTSWWGHCDIKAILESVHADMAESGGVVEFNSAMGLTNTYTRANLLEGLASELNIGSVHSPISMNGGITETGRDDISLGENLFGGARNDKRPDGLEIEWSGGRKYTFNVHLDSVSEVGKFDESMALGKAFQPFIEDAERTSFKKNESLLAVESGDTGVIEGDNRKISGKAEFYTVNENGQWVEVKEKFVIDPSNTDDKKFIVGSNIENVGSRTLTRYYFDPNTNELSSARTSFAPDASGKYVAKEENAEVLFKVDSLNLKRETTYGDLADAKAEIRSGAVRTGNQLAADSDVNEQVWNGATYQIREKLDWRSDDGKFERVTVYTESVFGTGKSGTLLIERNDEGEIINRHELSSPVDFHWRNVPRVTPLISSGGRDYLNVAMAERGLVSMDSLQTTFSAFNDLNTLLYLGLSAKDKEQVYTIVHEGQRLVYPDRATWEADVARLEASPN